MNLNTFCWSKGRKYGKVIELFTRAESDTRQPIYTYLQPFFVDKMVCDPPTPNFLYSKKKVIEISCFLFATDPGQDKFLKIKKTR